VRLALKVSVQNDGDFVHITLLYNRTRSYNSHLHSYADMPHQFCHNTIYFPVKISCLTSQLVPLKNVISNCLPNFFACPSGIYGVQNEAIPVILHAVIDETRGIQLDLRIPILGGSFGWGGVNFKPPSLYSRERVSVPIA